MGLFKKKFFTLLEAIIAIVIMSVLSVSVVYIFKESSGDDDIKARSSLLSAKKYLDSTVGSQGIESLVDLDNLGSENNAYIYTNSDSTNFNNISIDTSVELEKYSIAVYNGQGGCWILSRKFNVETANEASVFGYKATESCNATLADQLVSGSEYGSAEKPIIL